MAVPGLYANISLFGIAKELELNDYNNTIPIGTYQSYYATPISLKNMSTGAGGFDPINTANSIVNRPDGATPHGMGEFVGYDHDYSPGTTPQVSTSICNWSCKSPSGDLRMTGSVNTSTSGHVTTEYGFVWGSSTINPTIGAFGVTKTVVGTSNYNGLYTHFQSGNSIIMPCCCNTMDYYIRAYATNAIGTAYGVTRTVQVQDCGCGGGPGGPGGDGPGDGLMF